MKSEFSGQGKLHKVKFNNRWHVTIFVYFKMLSTTKSCNVSHNKNNISSMNRFPVLLATQRQ